MMLGAERSYSIVLQADFWRARGFDRTQHHQRLEGIRIILDKVLASRRVLRIASQRPADRILCAGADRARCPRSRRQSARCASTSRRDCTLEPVGDDKFAVRLGFRQVRGLSNRGRSRNHRRPRRPAVRTVDDLWRRADVPVSSLVQLAEADAMNESLGLARREALWALKAMRDEPLELFAAAAQREARSIEEVREPAVSLRPMTSGGEVVEDYRHLGLTLRQRRASCATTLQAVASSRASRP
jgi:hypothetical protein